MIDTTNYVSGRPLVACSQGRIRIIFDSGRIVRSDNFLTSFNGTSFTRPESIAWHDYYDLFSATCTDALGRLWVVWQSFRDYDQGYDHFQLFGSYYYNGTWSGALRVGAQAGYHDVQPAIASGTDNVVWCAFKSWRNGQGDIWVSNETNGGGWSAPVRLTTDSLDQIDPCVVVDHANRPWVFWQSQVNGRFRIQGRTATARGSRHLTLTHSATLARPGQQLTVTATSGLSGPARRLVPITSTMPAVPTQSGSRFRPSHRARRTTIYPQSPPTRRGLCGHAGNPVQPVLGASIRRAMQAAGPCLIR